MILAPLYVRVPSFPTNAAGELLGRFRTDEGEWKWIHNLPSRRSAPGQMRLRSPNRGAYQVQGMGGYDVDSYPSDESESDYSDASADYWS